MNERMVERAFEGHRFWDVNRWKKGEVLNSINRMQVTRDASTGVLTLAGVPRNRTWEDMVYLFPIPDSERRKNPNLTQNTGW